MTIKQNLRKFLEEQRRWVEQCGGDLIGYIAKYGAERGPAIYKADMDELRNLEKRA